jgi:hypothetical protein
MWKMKKLARLLASSLNGFCAFSLQTTILGYAKE